ncbi:hypothetical protein EOM81_12305 [bacterium]|nr:hypothetical protein [bacterium]
MEIKWVKLQTDIVHNRKIIAIRLEKNGNEKILLWFYLIILAGASNADGAILFTKNIAYDEKKLASEFKIPLKIVNEAIELFIELDMIHKDEKGTMFINNFNEYQNAEAMERLREAARERQKKYRESIKESSNASVTQHVTGKSVTKPLQKRDCNALDKDIDIEIDKEEDKDLELKGEIKTKEKKTVQKETAPLVSSAKKPYGEFLNVYLTDEEYQKLYDKFFDYKERIEKLSAYIKQKDKRYKSHYATLLVWSQKDDPATQVLNRQELRDREDKKKPELMSDEEINNLIAHMFDEKPTETKPAAIKKEQDKQIDLETVNDAVRPFVAAISQNYPELMQQEVIEFAEQYAAAYEKSEFDDIPEDILEIVRRTI